MLHHLSTAADAWDSMGRPDSELYRGVRLARIRDWWAGSTTTLTDTEQAFLVASHQQAELEERSAEERARAQARLIRRLRVVLTGAVVLLVLALAAGGVAAGAVGPARGDNAAQAVAFETGAPSRTRSRRWSGRLPCAPEATDDIDLSLLLAVAATRLDRSPRVRGRPGRRTLPQPRSDLVGGDQPARTTWRWTSAPTTEPWPSSTRTTGSSCWTPELGGCWKRRRRAPPGRVLTPGPSSSAPTGRPRRGQGARCRRGPVALLDAQTLDGVWHPAWGAASGRLARCRPRLQRGRPFPGGGAAEARRESRTTTAVVSTWAAVWRLDRPSEPDLLRLVGRDDGRPFVALSPDGGRLYALPDRVVLDLRTGERATFFPRPSGHGHPPRPEPGREVAGLRGRPRPGTAVVDTRSLREVRRLGGVADHPRRAVQRRRQPASHHRLREARPGLGGGDRPDAGRSGSHRSGCRGRRPRRRRPDDS